MFSFVLLRAKWKMLDHDLFVNSNYTDKQNSLWDLFWVIGFCQIPIVLPKALPWVLMGYHLVALSLPSVHQRPHFLVCTKFPLSLGYLAIVGKTSECQRLGPGLRSRQARQAAEACCLFYFVFTVLLLRVWGSKPTGC